MHTVFFNLKKLYDYELYSNVLPIVSSKLNLYNSNCKQLIYYASFIKSS